MNELKRLLPRHHKIIDLALEGWDRKAIAQNLDMTPEAVGGIMKSPIFQEELARRRDKSQAQGDEIVARERADAVKQAHDILKNASVKAANVHEACLDDPDPTVRQRSANEILDRAFGPKNGQGQGGSPSQIVIEAGSVQLLQTALQEEETYLKLNDHDDQPKKV